MRSWVNAAIQIKLRSELMFLFFSSCAHMYVMVCKLDRIQGCNFSVQVHPSCHAGRRCAGHHLHTDSAHVHKFCKSCIDSSYKLEATNNENNNAALYFFEATNNKHNSAAPAKIEVVLTSIT